MEAVGAIPCIIYAAKSTEDRRGSIPDQLQECRLAIESDPLRRLVAEYSDEAFSAYRRDRGPGLKDAFQHAEDLVAEQGIAELWAQHSDRLARGDGRAARHTVEIALWALKNDVRVRTLQDPDTFRDLLYAVVTGQRNNEDSRRKALSSQAGRKRAIARGEFVAHLPDGPVLRREVDDDGRLQRRMELDPVREPLIELIFRLALRGRTCGQIAKTVNAHGWLTKPVKRTDEPRPFDVGRIYETVKNPRYAALATYRGEVLARGHWPAYITERQHERIMHRLHRSRTGARRSAEPYLLGRLARCGHCGRALRAHGGRPTPDGTYTRRYVCGSHIDDRGRHQCHASPIHAHTLEAMLIANLDALLATPDAEDPQPAPVPPLTGASPDVRAHLRDAIAAEDDERLEHAIDRLLTSMQPYAALARLSIASQRRARELADAERLRVWVEREGAGRTPATRAQSAEMSRILRGWFASITARVDRATVTITAMRRRGAGAPADLAAVQISRSAWTRAAAPGRRGVTLHGTWEPAEVIGALQAWADEHGRSPTQLEWKLAAVDHPQSLAVRRHLGPWNHALRTAGLQLVVPPQRYEWTKAETVKALRAWDRRHGRAPFAMEWARAKPEHPSAATIRAHFGHWDDAIYAAGLRPLRRAKLRFTPWHPPLIIKALQDWTSAHGRAPKGLDWITAEPGRPCAGTVYNHFGTWAGALAAAGLGSRDS
jgi:hypothetical protein